MMGENKASGRMNIGLIAVIIFSFVTTYFAIIEIVRLITG